MLGGLLGGLINKEEITKDYIKDALEGAAQEFGLKHNELTFMIQPQNGEFDFKIWIIKLVNGAPKQTLREITVKEIVDGKEVEGE